VRRANGALAPARETRSRVIDGDAERRIREQFSNRGFPISLAAALDLGWLKAWVQGAVQKRIANRGPGSTPDPTLAFPLRPGAGFAWDPAAPKEVREASVATLARHQIRPARLRRELVNGVVDVVFAHLGNLQIEIAGRVTNALQRTRSSLDRSERYVDAVLGIDGATDVDPAAELGAIRRPRPDRGRG